ncbi:MAG: lysophospholipid acyltransferase family protein [Planctomycetaceae bacterium]|nr:lysophospholipid acyltransferase family protein [Planctomycetaceae bacterium]
MNDFSETQNSKADLYLHVGMPKTATSLLQKFLFTEHPQVEYLGKFIHGTNEKFPLKSIDSLMKRALGGEAVCSEADFEQLLEHSQAAKLQGKSLILSEELLSVGSLSQQHQAADLFKQYFPDCRIVVVLREPLEYLESLYFQRLKGFNLKHRSYHELKDSFGEPPRYFSINEWLDERWQHPEEPIREHLRYADLLEMYASIFGLDKLHVLHFSQLKSDSESFLIELSRAFEIDEKITINLISDKRVNDRWTQYQIEQLKSIHASPMLSREYQQLSHPKQRKEMLGLKGSESLHASDKATAEISDEWQSKIHRFFESQRNRLGPEWNSVAIQKTPDNHSAPKTGSSKSGTRKKQSPQAFDREKMWKRTRRTGTWEECCLNLASRMSYEWAIVFLRHVFSSRLLQSKFFPESRQRIQTIATWLNQPVDVNKAVSRHLFANECKDWRMLAFGEMSLDRIEKSVTIEGEEILEQYRGQQPGALIVNSHFGAARVVGKIIAEKNFPLTTISVGGRASKLANVEANLLLTKNSSPTQIVRQSIRDLESGRYLYISADGAQGDAGIEIDFLGRKRIFRTGFAQLAIKTGAPAIPIFATVDDRGIVNIQIHEPLDPGLNSQSKSERISHLVTQYARLLESYWIQDPGNIRQDQFEKHLHGYGLTTDTDRGETSLPRAA